MFGKSLAIDREHSVEATHAVFDDLWESFIVKDVDSQAYLKNVKKALLKFNSDNTHGVSLLNEE